MALFGPKFESGTEGPSLTATQGIFGGRVQPVEGPGTVQRRGRYVGEARRLAGAGADVRSEMATAMAKERSLIKWVSLRGAVLELSMNVEGGSVSIDQVIAGAPTPMPDGLRPIWESYDAISKMSFGQVLEDPELTRTDDWHLDVITWAVHASRAADVLLHAEIPRVGRLDAPGWYPEPVFCKSERYWDGSNWADKCRVLDGKTYRRVNSAF